MRDPHIATQYNAKPLKALHYNLSAIRGLLFATAAYREQLLQNYYDMGQRAVESGARRINLFFLANS